MCATHCSSRTSASSRTSPSSFSVAPSSPTRQTSTATRVPRGTMAPPPAMTSWASRLDPPRPTTPSSAPGASRTPPTRPTMRPTGSLLRTTRSRSARARRAPCALANSDGSVPAVHASYPVTRAPMFSPAQGFTIVKAPPSWRCLKFLMLSLKESHDSLKRRRGP